MRIITLNVNGIRSAARKGFFTWMLAEKADIVCLQEIKAQDHQLTDVLFCPEGYFCYYAAAAKPGYSGVAIYTKKKPKQVVTGLGFGVADTEGRYLQIDYETLSVASLYLPSGTSGEARQAIKYDFMHRFEKLLCKWAKQKRAFILCGDWNIAHQAIDLENWRANQKNTGFLPEERAWMDKLFTKMGYADAFRVVDPRPKQYTWWSNRGQAWAKNVGWRIDYQVISDHLKATVKSASIYKDERFSDHAPLMIDYALPEEIF